MIRRVITLLLASVVGGLAIFGGIALAADFTQATSLTADGFRSNSKHVVIHGTLSASAHQAFCTHNQPIKVTKLKTGKTKTTTTDNNGNYSVTFFQNAHKTRTYRASYGGRQQGVHPNRQVCLGSSAQTTVH